jgi:hypothetical protein
LASDPLLTDFRLVGGTALALRLGHRTSVDLDFFNDEGRECGDWTDSLSVHGHTRLEQASPHIHVYVIAGIKVDVVSLKHAWLEPLHVEDDLRLASMLDIAAMKLAAITNRGTRKDFVDLAFLLESFDLNRMMDAYARRCPDGSPFLVLKSLSFPSQSAPSVGQPSPRLTTHHSQLTTHNSLVTTNPTSAPPPLSGTTLSTSDRSLLTANCSLLLSSLTLPPQRTIL